MRKHWFKAGTAALAVTALVAVGCGGDDEEPASAGEATAMTASAEKPAGAPTETGAAELRATLTAALQEHVYLAALALQDEKAVPTLDKNSVGLSKAIGSVYGADAGRQFLALWREHIGFFVNYAKGDKGARADLDGYRAEFGAFLAAANPNLTEEAVATELEPHVDSVIAVIDSLKAKDGKTYDLLQEAAGHMPQTANVLAGAIVKQFPEKFGSR